MKNQIIFLIFVILLLSCKEKSNSTIENKSYSSIKKQKNYCFQKIDSLKVFKIINTLVYKSKKEEDISSLTTKKYIEKFKKFPYELFNKAIKNNAKPDFEIKNTNIECNILPIYYNYTIKIIDDGEEYSSESSFILYFIKNNNEEILLDNFGAAG